MEKICLNILEKYYHQTHLRFETINIDSHWLSDLDIFVKNGLYEKLNYNHSIFGKTYLSLSLKNPIFNYKNQLPIIKDLDIMGNENIIQIRNILKQVNLDSNDILWFWKEPSKKEKLLLEQVTLPDNKYIDLNGKVYIVVFYFVLKTYLMPIYQIISPIIGFILPYFVVKYWMKLPINITLYWKLMYSLIPSLLIPKRSNIIMSTIGYLTGFLYLYNIYHITTEYLRYYRINYYISEKISKLANFYRSLIKLNILIPNKFHKQFNLSELDYLKNYVQNNYFGTAIYYYKNFMKNDKTKLEKLFMLYGYLENTVSTLDFYQKIGYLGYPLCFSHISSEIELNTKNIWSPCLISNKPVYNSLKQDNTIVLTGPNGSGKSQLMKSVFYNVLLTYMYGFACASWFQIPKFTYLFTHIKKEDQEGKYSLFQSEISHLSKIVNHCESNIFFGLFDEMCTSTNFYEGSACCYAITDYLSKKNGLSIVATHFKILNKLNENNDSIKNMKMRINGMKNFTFQVIDGINEINLALEILKDDKTLNKLYFPCQNILNN